MDLESFKDKDSIYERRKFREIYWIHVALSICWRTIKKYTKHSYRSCMCISYVLSSIAWLCISLRYRTRAENQYDITLRLASSRFVTSQIPEKTGHDEAAFTWRARGGDQLYFFGPSFVCTRITLCTEDKPRIAADQFFCSTTERQKEL